LWFHPRPAKTSPFDEGWWIPEVVYVATMTERLTVDTSLASKIDRMGFVFFTDVSVPYTLVLRFGYEFI
jgi:hypothetical protein